ncbi:MAG: putative adenine modification enzyme [Prokaryotic dsDNA virus sp.]|nr:MAG: putative adenine modification enzyme [Prokaryotic dsDNA virus sp.]|tara:strand:- start:19128 stop:19796 length:669 start_codon:yes stop_codon:yes gene_type:complete
MLDYSISLIEKPIAKEIIVANHYTHKWSSCRYALGLFLGDELHGVAIYGFPVGRQVVKSISPQLENQDVLELTRLWLRDEAPKNSESFFIGQTFKWLKENTDTKVLISYADPMADHLGIIYQATNWLYQGNNTMLVKGYLHKINGEWMHPRSAVAKYGTVKTSKLLEIDPEYERKELKKKHRYIYILTDKREKRKILATLKHPVLPYPKNNKNCEWQSLNRP